MGIEFKYPILLLLLIPAGWLIFLYLKQKSPGKALIACIRSAVFLLLIMALAIPQIVLPIKGQTVIFLTDRSASVGNMENDALSWLEEAIGNKAANDRHGIASFGGNIQLEQTLTAGKQGLTQFNGKIDAGDTNLEAAIQSVSSLFPHQSGGRIVLISDGNETAGNSADAVRMLKNRGIELDYVLLDGEAGEDVSIKELNVSPTLYIGEEVPLLLTVESNAAKTAVIRISVNHQEVLQEKVNVKAGANVYQFSYKPEEAGLHVFKAEIEADGDTFIENNVMQQVANVKGTPKLLLVQQEGAADISGAFSGLDVDTALPEGLPTTLSGFLKYESIVFENVPATSVTEPQMQLIEQAVKEFGTGFVMTGGEESFGLGGYFKTPIEKLLPVDMEIKGKNEMPSLGLVIVMDRSGSMIGDKLELAKEAAARSVELLREEDTLGFIAFDDRPWEIVETEPLADKQKVAGEIRSVTPGGGTEIFSSLELAYENLQDLKLQRKHIILLTDGQSASNGDYDALIEAGKEKNITLSTVALGSDADRGLLESLAELGSGRFYDVTDSSVIPSILSRETVMATRTYIEDNPFYPLSSPHPDWSTLFADGVPQMNAYIATTAKNRASLPLVSTKDDPVLAEWQYGMGKTIAFTSDLSGKWAGDWARWEKWPVFLNQLVANTLPQYESEPFSLEVVRSNEGTVLTVQSAAKTSLPMEAAVVSEKGEPIETNVKLSAPGKYEITIPEKAGMFYLSLKQTDAAGDMNMYQTGFTIPYSAEYLLQGKNESLLKELSANTGGRQLKQAEEAFRPLADQPKNIQPISSMLILVAFLLFFTEIAIRRFGLPKKWKGIKRADKPERLGKQVPNRLDILREKPKQKEILEQKEMPKQEAAPKKVSKKPKKPALITKEEREERMKRLLEAKNRKK